MAELTVNMVYGSALYEAAKESKQEDQVLSELNELLAIFRQDPSFLEFISTPVISKGEKKEALKAIFEGKLASEVLNFLYILIDKSRARYFEGMVEHYKSVMDKDRKIAVGDIYSAIELTGDQVASFEKQVSTLLKENVRLVNKQDPSLIGGVKIFVEGKVIDASIKSRLRSMKDSLGTAVI